MYGSHIFNDFLPYPLTSSLQPLVIGYVRCFSVRVSNHLCISHFSGRLDLKASRQGIA